MVQKKNLTKNCPCEINRSKNGLGGTFVEKDPQHYATKIWSWSLPADFMIDSEYFFIAEPESAVQISVRACVRELFAIRGFFHDFPRNVVF